mmetsp:Transcript_16000/g.24125  ORF Transcript_16000/g.24125 Transcript_16000/m.24125 type:complete len:295 (-) Transcript_16000:1620-2504(-)
MASSLRFHSSSIPIRNGTMVLSSEPITVRRLSCCGFMLSLMALDTVSNSSSSLTGLLFSSLSLLAACFFAFAISLAASFALFDVPPKTTFMFFPPAAVISRSCLSVCSSIPGRAAIRLKHSSSSILPLLLLLPSSLQSSLFPLNGRRVCNSPSNSPGSSHSVDSMSSTGTGLASTVGGLTPLLDSISCNNSAPRDPFITDTGSVISVSFDFSLYVLRLSSSTPTYLKSLRTYDTFTPCGPAGRIFQRFISSSCLNRSSADTTSSDSVGGDESGGKVGTDALLSGGLSGISAEAD